MHIVKLEKNANNGYIIRAPKGHVLMGPVYLKDEDTAIRWAKNYISSFPDWQLDITV